MFSVPAGRVVLGRVAQARAMMARTILDPRLDQAGSDTAVLADD